MSTNSIDDVIGMLQTWERIFLFPRREHIRGPFLRPHPADIAKADILREEINRLVDLSKQALRPAT